MKKLLSLFLALAMMATMIPAAAAAGFADVDGGAWYADAVDYVVSNKLMSGYSADKFGPNDTLNRAMVVQILYNKEGQPAPSGKHEFNDVASGDWFNNAVTWGTKRGVMSGYGGGRFAPNDNVTLEQIAVILWNYSGNPAFTAKADSVGTHSSWAANGLAWAIENNLFSNVPYISVTSAATRAQTAQMLTNYLTKRHAGKILTIGIQGETNTNNNPLTLYLEENLGIDIQFVNFSSLAADWRAQFNAMLAAGEPLPDIMWGFAWNEQERYDYGRDRYLVDLTPFLYSPQAAEYRTKIDNMFGEGRFSKIMRNIASPDGGIYGFPTISTQETPCCNIFLTEDADCALSFDTLIFLATQTDVLQTNGANRIPWKFHANTSSTDGMEQLASELISCGIHDNNLFVFLCGYNENNINAAITYTPSDGTLCFQFSMNDGTSSLLANFDYNLISREVSPAQFSHMSVIGTNFYCSAPLNFSTYVPSAQTLFSTDVFGTKLLPEQNKLANSVFYLAMLCWENTLLTETTNLTLKSLGFVKCN